MEGRATQEKVDELQAQRELKERELIFAKQTAEKNLAEMDRYMNFGKNVVWNSEEMCKYIIQQLKYNYEIPYNFETYLKKQLEEFKIFFYE